jgi:hypothetical protein
MRAAMTLVRVVEATEADKLLLLLLRNGTPLPVALPA